MSSTQAVLAISVYAELVGGDVGQNPSADDIDKINQYILRAVSELQGKSIVYISDLDAIEDELFSNLSGYVANNAAHEFGGKIDKELKRYHENELRVLARQTPGYGPQQVSDF